MKRLKRFYDTVSIGNTSDNMFTLLLDGKSVRTPLGKRMVFAKEGLAAAIATEWQLQTEFVIPNTMPMNTMYMTWVDVDSQYTNLEKWDQVAKYFRTDTLRFRDTDNASQLAEAQKTQWKCVESFLDASLRIHLARSANGIFVPAEADTEIKHIYDNLVSQYPPLKMTILETASKYSKSGSIAVALLEGAVSADEAFRAAYVEEMYQRKEWGEAEGDHDISNAETLLWLNGASILSSLV